MVNDARGEVLDELALADALKEKKIAGAAIDVYASEPPAKDHPLFALENVVLTPHIGGATYDTEANHTTIIANGLAQLLKGEVPDNCVNPEVLI